MTCVLKPADVAITLRTYARADALETPGPISLRPWHLPWFPECGLKGVADPAARLKLDTTWLFVCLFVCLFV